MREYLGISVNEERIYRSNERGNRKQVIDRIYAYKNLRLHSLVMLIIWSFSLVQM